MDFDKLLEKRISIKKYSSKKPPLDKVMEAIEAANMAPAAGNLQILKYIIVENPETISKIADACQQQFIKDTPYVIVVCSDLKQVKKLYDIRADKYLKHNAGAAVNNFLLKITDLGLASNWVGAFSVTTIRNALQIPDNINVEVILPVGYELIKGKTKPRYKHTLTNKVFSETWQNKYKPFAKIRRADV